MTEKAVECMGEVPAGVENKPYVSISKDVPAYMYGVAKVPVVNPHKTVNDACRSVSGLRSGTGETSTLTNELGSLTTFGKANFI